MAGGPAAGRLQGTRQRLRSAVLRRLDMDPCSLCRRRPLRLRRMARQHSPRGARQGPGAAGGRAARCTPRSGRPAGLGVHPEHRRPVLGYLCLNGSQRVDGRCTPRGRHPARGPAADAPVRPWSHALASLRAHPRRVPAVHRTRGTGIAVSARACHRPPSRDHRSDGLSPDARPWTPPVPVPPRLTGAERRVALETGTGLDALRLLTPPPANPDLGGGAWEELFEDLGTALPSEYVALMELYGARLLERLAAVLQSAAYRREALYPSDREGHGRVPAAQGWLAGEVSARHLARARRFPSFRAQHRRR